MESENKKIYVEETIGSRRYFSYRADLLLYKLILCIVLYLIIYSITSKVLISIIFTVQVFLLFTLINKLIIERKVKEGKELLLVKFKKKYFSKKINEMDMNEFEKFIKYYLEKHEYLNLKKSGKNLYLVSKLDEDFYIKIYKFHEGAEIEKTDVRNLISIANNHSIKNIIIATINNLSDEAKESIKALDSSLNIEIINIDKLYDFAYDNDYLPDDNYFYNQIKNSKTKSDIKKHKVIKNNIFDTKKIAIYLVASIFFYIMSSIMYNNYLTRYISYYFLVLTIINVGYYIFSKFMKTTENK